MESSSLPVFDYVDYRDFLSKRMASSGPTRGLRTKLASFLGCESAYISRILSGLAQLNPEQALKTAKFLGMGENETTYFLLLVNRGRAGSKDLEDFLDKQIQAIRRQRKEISERLGGHRPTLSAEAQMTYYSAWYYSAVHVMLLIPKFRSSSAISRHLGIAPERVAEVLEFLVRNGFASEKQGQYRPGANRIHLPSNSPMISKAHTNWRIRAIHSLESASQNDLHYSGPVCLSESDAKKVRELLLQAIEKTEKILDKSPDETVFCLNMDFFAV